MARKPAKVSLKWFDPRIGDGLPFVWDDGVHIVKKVELTPNGIAYILKCGTMFTFETMGDVKEAKISLPFPTCPKCLE